MIQNKFDQDLKDFLLILISGLVGGRVPRAIEDLQKVKVSSFSFQMLFQILISKQCNVLVHELDISTIIFGRIVCILLSFLPFSMLRYLTVLYLI